MKLYVKLKDSVLARKYRSNYKYRLILKRYFLFDVAALNSNFTCARQVSVWYVWYLFESGDRIFVVFLVKYNEIKRNKNTTEHILMWQQQNRIAWNSKSVYLILIIAGQFVDYAKPKYELSQTFSLLKIHWSKYKVFFCANSSLFTNKKNNQIMMSNNFDNGLFKCLDLTQKLEN